MGLCAHRQCYRMVSCRQHRKFPRFLIIDRSGQNLDEYSDVPIHSFLT